MKKDGFDCPNDDMKTQTDNWKRGVELIADDMTAIYYNLQKNPIYEKCLRDIEKIIPDISARRTSRDKMDLSDLFKAINLMVGRLTDVRLKISVYTLGKRITDTSGRWGESCAFTQRIVDCYEMLGEYEPAIEIEERYCRNKHQLFPSEFVFGHYVNLIRLNESLGISEKTPNYVSKLSHLFSSQDDGSEAIAAIERLSDFFIDKGAADNGVMRSVLEIFDEVFYDKCNEMQKRLAKLREKHNIR